MKINVVTIGGGTGQYHVLRALMQLHDSKNLSLTAIPTTIDSGGSSGELRLDYHIVAPGDISQCIFGLHPNPEQVSWLFAHRFNGGKGLDGHTVRNLIVTAAFQQFGNTQRALDAIEETFGLRGSIRPATFSKCHLNARLKNGTVLTSESAVYEADVVAAGGVDELWLSPEAKVNPAAVEAIEAADAVIICPGTLLCSIIPNFLAEDIREALCHSKARKIYIANLMNRRGHANRDWTVLDHVKYLETYLEPSFFSVVIANSQPLTPEQESVYCDEKIAVPSFSNEDMDSRIFIGVPLLADTPVEMQTAGDTLAHLRASVRHDPDRLAAALAIALPSEKALHPVFQMHIASS